MKYIDAEKLIERLEEMKRAEYENCGGVNSKTGALQEVQELIASLQQEQPEVNLEKEIKDWCNENITGVRPIYTADSLIYALLPKTARHFYELGLNARMEKSNGVDGVVHHALKSHWIVTDKNKLAAILKAFPEGAEVELFVCAKKEKTK